MPLAQPAETYLNTSKSKRFLFAGLTVWLASLFGCGSGIHTAAPGVTAPAVQPLAPTSLVITHGGTYSGTWASNDSNTPAVNVVTDEPVVIQNSSITSRGDLIHITGSAGANVTVQNVTGTGEDPQIAGVQRGSFVNATAVVSLTVEHCTIAGTRHGVSLSNSTTGLLRVRYNSAADLEDRASDGAGGFQNARPDLGHFVVLHGVGAVNAAEISWNQVVQTMGHSSTEDGISVYKSQGTAASPIAVHDNYFEGASSPATTAYSGNGLIADGDRSMPVTAYVLFDSNQVIHTAGGGVMIANGHDITARNNRVVSCGKNPDGTWYARKQVTAVSLWNYYGAPQFTNNVITGTAGGMVVPDSNGTPVASDLYTSPTDLMQGNTVSGNLFTDPCLSGTSISSQAETNERTLWAAKLSASANTVGSASQ